MATLNDRSYGASKLSLELLNLESDSMSSDIKIIFNCGKRQLDFKFPVLRSDLETLSILILNNWDEMLRVGVWDSTEPAFSFSLQENNSELVDEKIYQFQFWIDAGEFYSHRCTRSGIGITIYQDREAIEKFALQVKSELN
ncbi:hypothetical protein [Lysinibacillus sp. RC79]|uniref:hypothetical protein n=1 Tax=Lysinibacillus sp. RC79 TaxID=3156296 RepID=UPI003513DC01